MLKKILLIGLSLAIIGGFIGYRMYNKPHEDMSRVRADHSITAEELFTEYSVDESTANSKFLGKKIQISGHISNIEKQGDKVERLTLETGDVMTSINAELDELTSGHRTDFAIGEDVLLMCICTGKLMDVELNRCVEIK